MDEIAVLIPCFNEEITVGKVVRDFKRVLPQATVYVYDNNSTDKTVEKAKEAGAIVRHEYQQGKGNVVRRMFQEVEAQCYILVDADDTYPASEAAKMTERVLKYQVCPAGAPSPGPARRRWGRPPAGGPDRRWYTREGCRAPA